MNKETSIYLDAVRFIAAAAVFLDHTSGQRLTGGLFWQFGRYGPEAVSVFFVLSGFVIAHVTAEREHGAGSYALARAARILSVAVPALLLTFALDAIGRAINPDMYTLAWNYHANGRLWQAISGLLFINGAWSIGTVIGSNLSYWTLGMEVPYYLIWGLATYAPRNWRAPAVMLALVAYGPAVAALFPVWLLGVGAYHFTARRQIGARLGVGLCVLPMLAWAIYEVWVWRGGVMLPNVAALFPGDLTLQHYLLGTFFACHIVGFNAIAHEFAAPIKRFERPIRWTAGATFSLYLFHLPIAQFIASVMPWPPWSTAGRVAVYAGTLVAVFVLAEVSERRKAQWRQALSALLPIDRTARARPTVVNEA